MASAGTPDTALKWLDRPKSGVTRPAKFQASRGVTKGELETPETAFLICPERGQVETSDPSIE